MAIFVFFNYSCLDQDRRKVKKNDMRFCMNNFRDANLVTRFEPGTEVQPGLGDF
jgi:hypothetical protein